MGLHDHHHHSHRAGQQQQQQELRQPLPPHPLAFYPQIFFAGLVCMLLGQLVEVGMPVKLMGAKVFDLRPPRRSLKRTAAAVTWNCSVLKRQHSFNCCFSSWDFFFHSYFFFSLIRAIFYLFSLYKVKMSLVNFKDQIISSLKSYVNGQAKHNNPLQAILFSLFGFLGENCTQHYTLTLGKKCKQILNYLKNKIKNFSTLTL